MRKKPALIACLAVLAVAIAGGVAFYVVSVNEEQAIEERQQEVLGDLSYAFRYNFTYYTDSDYLNSDSNFLSLADLETTVREDPTRYTRVDFYDERPADFGPEEVEEGAVVVFPTGLTKASLDELNDAIGKYGIDASSFGLGQEVTLYDVVHRRAEVQSLVSVLGASIRSDIYSPRITVVPDLDYASDLNFALYTRSGELDRPGMADKVLDDPTADYFRVDFYDALPEGFDPKDIEDGVIVAVPTERTQKSVDRLNDLIRQYDIDTASDGLGSEVTVHDAVHDPMALQFLLYDVQKASPEETAALKDSIRNPE